MKRNVLVMMSDEHSSKALGCYGSAIARTPNLDRLAARGARFANACTNSPICVPARAAFATGRYAFDTGCWDNALAYRGTPTSWGHALRAHGVPSVSIGKLHYRSAEDDTGFDDQVLPMHVVDGVGDLLGSVRDPLPVRRKSAAVATEIGPGESAYTRYDRDITDAACRWLGTHGAQGPWVLFVGWVAPHFPLIAPPEFYALHDPMAMPMPKACRPDQWPRHPWLEAFRRCFVTDEYFTDETRRIALASYHGLVSFMDHNVGRVLAALEACGAAGDTTVIYTSDHGDNLGARGLWGKSTMYEESVGIPMIVRDARVPSGVRVDTPVSLVDLHPTLLDASVGAPAAGVRGTSLLPMTTAPTDEARAVFAEYHAAGAPTGAFMLRRATMKYVYYVGMPPQLFDLAMDPEELDDLAALPGSEPALESYEAMLRGICDPEAVDARAKADQAALLERHGGRDAVVQRGGFGATPAPGQAVQYR